MWSGTRKATTCGETIKKKITLTSRFKSYTIHASKEEPQYSIKSYTTGHLAMQRVGTHENQKHTMSTSRITTN
jgi:hypothetical protein